MFVRNLDHKRGEELFIHAVAHLHNRYREDLTDYQGTQAPVPREDWQELEASWFEIAFRSSTEGRQRRLTELYAIHTAIKNNTYSPALIFPFSESDLFHKVTQHNVVIRPHSGYSDYQYGHYVLAPLVMTAIEGLLQNYHTGTNIEAILTELHLSAGSNFFEKLRSILPHSEIERIFKWMRGEETIPHDLIFSALEYYDSH
jgi:hypothetical protein